MGSLTRQRSRERFYDALQQRLRRAENSVKKQQVCSEAIDKLVDIAIDEEELDRVSRELAVRPEEIEFPDYE